MNLKLAYQLVKNMGLRYTAYRVRHEIEKRTGGLKKKHPTDLSFTKPVALTAWKNSKNPFVIDDRDDLIIPRNPSDTLKQKAERILNGEIQYFNAGWLRTDGANPWLTNPSNGYRYDSTKHWSQIPDLSEEAGDIKYVWEKSRFSYLLTLIRYDHHFETDVSEFVFSEIESWIDANPINRGPNWRCSQEISLRMFNWCYALYYYQYSEALTEERWQKIQQVIYASVHHVYHHIDFSRIAVRNNHAVTETLFLALSRVLFPFIPETEKWSVKGKNWFEEEIDYQIYDDGTFLQFSMNYHRVMIQLLSFGIAVMEKNGQQFSGTVYTKAYRSLDFLYQCMQEENGWLPNYGSNDGALFFPLAEADYRDYRPQLNTLHKILTGEPLFNEEEINEDYCWLQTKAEKLQKPLQKKYGPLSYDHGGFYLCRTKETFTMIRCGNHKDRPAQADNLHVDLWYKGVNIFRDSGTYQYNTDAEKLNYFMGSRSHNVVMVEEHSQMLKGGRFIWYYWTQKKKAVWTETEGEYVFSGEIRAFTFLNKDATHKRTVVIKKDTPEWKVKDEVKGLDGFPKKQIWHPHQWTGSIEAGPTEPVFFDSYNSDYYGLLTAEKSLYFPFDKDIETTIKAN